MLLLKVSIIVVAIVAANAVAQSGFIQIKAEPGIAVFLDGEPAGVTDREVGGLLLLEVPSGQRTLRFVKEGFEPREVTLAVELGRVAVYEVGQLRPQLRISEQGDSARIDLRLLTGTLIIQSLPVESRLDIPSLGVSQHEKTRDVWRAEQVPVGVHAVTITALGRQASLEVTVTDGQQTRVFALMVSDPPQLTVQHHEAPGLVIERLSPNPVRSSQQRQAVQIHGRGFRPDSLVYVYSGDQEFLIPPERRSFISAERIDITAGLFPAGTNWAIVVVNPGQNSSARLGFTVVD